MSITIDKDVVDPDDVEMLQDLITAAVNDGVRQVKAGAEREDGSRHRRPAHPGHLGLTWPAALIEPVARLIEALSRLPGVGPKTAQRLTYHLLRAPEAEARALAAALIAVRDEVVYCESCFNISTGPLCPICADPSRDDVAAVRRRGAARRAGASSARAPSRAATTSCTARSRRWTASAPIGCKVRELLERAAERGRDGEPYEEVVLATNPTLEGEATAMYLAERLTRRRAPHHKDRARDPGWRRPRVRRRGDPRPGDAGPARVRGGRAIERG